MQTAAIGTLVSGATMFFVDGIYATACCGILIFIFLVIHYTTPPKPWGDVSQSLIYHQVRKYLLRLRQDHVKFWRPQILLLINDPRRQYKLIQFCNSLKKGALFILGHVIVTQDFPSAVPEARKQQTAWTKYIDFSKIKAFVNIAISPAVEWGARNIVLSAGLGGMRPNIVMMGFFNLSDLRSHQPLIDISGPTSLSASWQSDEHPKRRRRSSKNDKLRGKLPTDANRAEGAISAQSYVTILEDLLLSLQINVALAKGFQDLEFPAAKPSTLEKSMSFLGFKPEKDEESFSKYIDLWPIQMSAEIATEGDKQGQNVLTTNFDTYTLILQLGCILTTVPSWKRAYRLRVSVFVEYESDVEEERKRVSTLLYNLRIEADIRVFWLANGSLKSYEVIVNGKVREFTDTSHSINDLLQEEEWWNEIRTIRGQKGAVSAAEELAQVEGLLGAATTSWPESTFLQGRQEANIKRFSGLRKLLKKSRRKSVSGVKQLGASYGMRTHRLSPDLVGLDSDDDDSSTPDGILSSDENYSDNAVSENDADNYGSEDERQRPKTPIRRSKTVSEGVSSSNFSQRSLRKPLPNIEIAMAPEEQRISRTRTMPQTVMSDTNLSAARTLALSESDMTVAAARASATQPTTPTQSQAGDAPLRPLSIRHRSVPKFTSKPTPRTAVSSEDGPGRSIMFTEQPSPPPRHATIHKDATPAAPKASESQASASPFSQAIPLSFNDLPSRAQHLILNELIRSESELTAVLLTTLPSPVKGTCQSEADSIRYLSELEILCQDLPPVLLIHSNSMTVTMNL